MGGGERKLLPLVAAASLSSETRRRFATCTEREREREGGGRRENVHLYADIAMCTNWNILALRILLIFRK